MSLYSDTILPPRQGRGLPRWAVAAIVVLAIHLAIGVILILRHVGTPPVVAPPDAVMINLAPVAAAPAKPPAAPPVAPPPPEHVPELPAVMSSPIVPKEPPIPDVLKAPPPPPEHVPEVPATMSSPTVPVAPPVPTILKAPTVPKVKPLPKKHVEHRHIERHRRIERERRLRAERAHQRARGARRAAASHASRRSLASWASLVQGRVEAAKRYPRAARTRGVSGAAVLAFTVDARGRVVAARIVRSSGSAILDRATLAMARRVGRLPPPPAGRVTLRVRVDYRGR